MFIGVFNFVTKATTIKHRFDHVGIISPKNEWTWPLKPGVCFYPLLSGWWLTYPSEKYEFVSWDDDIPNIWKNKSHVPNHQAAVDV